MQDWNVVVTLAPEGFRDAFRILRQFGRVDRTRYRDVLVMRVDREAHAFLEALHDLLTSDATLANAVARLIPATERFCFRSQEEFRSKAREAVRPWAAEVAGKSFYVRMHRRGFKGELNSHEEERALGHFLIQCEPEQSGTRVAFDNPEVIIAIETVGGSAGLSRWSRADRERHELLRFD